MNSSTTDSFSAVLVMTPSSAPPQRSATPTFWGSRRPHVHSRRESHHDGSVLAGKGPRPRSRTMNATGHYVAHIAHRDVTEDSDSKLIEAWLDLTLTRYADRDEDESAVGEHLRTWLQRLRRERHRV